MKWRTLLFYRDRICKLMSTRIYVVKFCFLLQNTTFLLLEFDHGIKNLILNQIRSHTFHSDIYAWYALVMMRIALQK